MLDLGQYSYVRIHAGSCAAAMYHNSSMHTLAAAFATSCLMHAAVGIHA